MKLRQDSDYVPRQWADSERRPVDSRIDSIVADILVYAAEENRRQEEREAWHREWEARQRRAEEEHQRRELEARRRKGLLAEAEAWSTAKLLRRYVAAAKQAGLGAAGKAFTTEENWRAWLEWAAAYAQRLDPIEAGLVGRRSSVSVPASPAEDVEAGN